MTEKSVEPIDRADQAAHADPSIWVDEYGDELFRYAYKKLRNQQWAEDVVQETFLAAWKSHLRFQGKSSERTWLIGILKHKIIDFLRKLHRSRKFENNIAEPQEPNDFDSLGHWKQAPKSWGHQPDKALENQEFWETFQSCLQHLPNKLATAVSMVELEGQSTQNVCSALSITPNHLGVLLYRARTLLRNCLESNWFCHPKEKNSSEKNSTGKNSTGEKR